MAKKKSKAENDTPGINFEEAISEIQGIVQQLEDGDLGLEESLKRFEEGVRLIRTCHATLETAEQRIKVLTDVDSEGNPVLSDFDASATIDENRKTAGRRKRKTDSGRDSESDGSSLF